MVPTDLAATPVSSSQVELFWSPLNDEVAVEGYYVYRDGSQVADVSTTSYSDTGLSASTTYSYAVAAYDAAGKLFRTSSNVASTTLSSGASGLTGATWACQDRLHLYTGNDLWPFTWSDDDKQYTAWGDGNGFDSVDRYGGQVGSIEDASGVFEPDPNTWTATELAAWTPDGGGPYPNSIISIGGVFYMLLNANGQEQLWKSTDKGQNWSELYSWAQSGAVPLWFINMGQDQTAAIDGYVYVGGLNFDTGAAPPSRGGDLRVSSYSVGRHR